MLLCLRTLILSLLGRTAAVQRVQAPTDPFYNRKKIPKIILNTYSEVFGAAYGYRLFFWTVLSIVLGEGLEVTVKGPRAKILFHVKHYICTQRLFELTRVPNLQSNFNLSPVTAIFWLLKLSFSNSQLLQEYCITGDLPTSISVATSTEKVQPSR
jgi:hypothetical protein